MINSRSLSDLTVDAQAWFERWRCRVERETNLLYGFDWIVTSTYRDQEQQDALFHQGRDGNPGKIVTWTRYSRHTGRRAWDIAIRDRKTGQIDWSVKADTDGDNRPDYQELADVGKAMGLNCGAFWKKKDFVHYELPETVG